MTGCPMLVSRDVAASAAWYAEVLGGHNVHPGDEFAMVMMGSNLVVMLHHVEFGEHPGLSVPAAGSPGSGVLLYFWVDDVAAAYERARGMGANLLDEPHENPNSKATEFSLRDPNGYAVTVSARMDPNRG